MQFSSKTLSGLKQRVARIVEQNPESEVLKADIHACRDFRVPRFDPRGDNL